MAISVGDALLKIGVDTKDLDKGLEGLGNRIKQHQRAIGLGMAAMGGAILAAGVLSVKTFAQMGDEVQKMALSTGFSTEALSELRHAAEISGASLSTLEKGIKRLSSTILDAQDGMETYIRAFDHIGVKVEELEGLKAEEQFFKIAMAVAEVEDPMKRAALAQDFFGRAGTELLPLLAQGAEGIEKLRQEAHDLGIVFDQETANAAAELTDAMGRLGKSTSGIKMIIATQLVPALIPLIDKVTTIIKGMIDWSKQHPFLTKALVLTTGAVGGLLIAMGGLLLLMPAITAAITFLTGQVGLNTIAWVKNTVALIAHKFASIAGVAATGALTVSIMALTVALSALLVGLGLVAFGIWKIVEAKRAYAKEMELYQQRMREYYEQQALYEEMSAALEAGEMERYERLRNEYLIMTGQIDELTNSVLRLGAAYQTSGEQTISAIQATQEISETSIDAVTLSAMKAIEKVRKSVMSLAEQRLRAGEVLGAGEERYGPVTGAMLEAGYTDLRDWWEAGAPGAPEEYHYQHGGIAMHPQLASVAEREPEMIAPLSKIRQILGNPVNIIHVYLDGNEVGKNVIDHITERVALQGGF